MRKRKIRKDKKAMEAGRVFAYALALIVISLIMVYGYQQVIGFKNRANQVLFLKFQEQMKNDIKGIATDYDTVRFYTYKLPSDFDEVCFVDESCKTTRAGCIDQTERPIIHNAVWVAKVPESVFVVKGGRMEESIDVGKISVLVAKVDGTRGWFGCLPVKNSEIRARVKGLGDKAQIMIDEGEAAGGPVVPAS